MWTDEGTDLGGTVGGDGAGESWSRRFTKRNDDGTFAVITSYYYPVNIGERYSEDEREDAALFDVENMTEFLVCTSLEDPGGTEVWTRYDYSAPCDFAFDTEAEAFAYCEREARAETARLYPWDGLA